MVPKLFSEMETNGNAPERGAIKSAFMMPKMIKKILEERRKEKEMKSFFKEQERERKLVIKEEKKRGERVKSERNVGKIKKTNVFKNFWTDMRKIKDKVSKDRRKKREEKDEKKREVKCLVEKWRGRDTTQYEFTDTRKSERKRIPNILKFLIVVFLLCMTYIGTQLSEPLQEPQPTTSVERMRNINNSVRNEVVTMFSQEILMRGVEVVASLDPRIAMVWKFIAFAMDTYDVVTSPPRIRIKSR